MASPVTLARLADVTGARLVGEGSVVVSDVHHDSRQLGPGELFVAVSGFHLDGHQFAAGAVAAGAAGVCVEREMDGLEAPQLVVPSTRRALPVLAAEVHGLPSEQLAVIGITGTDGKTTVAGLVESAVAADGKPAGFVGTIGCRIAGEQIPLSRTSPEASDFQRLLARMVDAGVEIAAVEVSSHALSLGRADATRFAVVAFTNLSQDHLDFHGDMEDYFAAKASLFAPGRAAHAVVWVDDPWGRRLLADHVSGPVTTVSMAGPADVYAEGLRLGRAGSSFELVTPQGRAAVTLGIAGRFNVANALMAAACAQLAGVTLGAIGAGLADAAGLPGRFEPIDSGPGSPAVFVDYAHTPAGIAASVGAARELTSGRVIAVAGAGGDRDQAKRPLMGAAAAASDLFVLTSDNPRSEDPASIAAAVLAGAVQAGGTVLEEPDRRLAIRAALAAATADDVVLILGKGHEVGQERAGVVAPFDDRDVAREELARLKGDGS